MSDTIKGLTCPSCKHNQVHTLTFNFAKYLQCLRCKFWSTKFTPEQPGIFKGEK